MVRLVHVGNILTPREIQVATGAGLTCAIAWDSTNRQFLGMLTYTDFMEVRTTIIANVSTLGRHLYTRP
eukprot:SAG31_NODE_17136_length_682_cov_0.704974_1_plen_68_part_10